MLIPITHVNEHTFREGKYFVDTDGYIISEEQYHPGSYNQLKGFPDGRRGYLKVKLYNTNGKGVTFSVHRLVYMISNGLPYNVDKQVNHIDGDKLNNALCNLELVTARENVVHSINNKLSESRSHQLTLSSAVRIYIYLINNANHKSYAQLARDIGYDNRVVSQLLNKTHPLSDQIDDYLSHQ